MSALWRARDLLSRAAGRLGGYAIARRLTRNAPRILMYHRFAASGSPSHLGRDEFDRQLEEIGRHYRVVTLGELAAELRERGRAESDTVVITVDDGYRDFHEHAFPALQRRGMKATIFVTTGFLDQQLWLWPDLLDYGVRHTRRQNLVIHAGGAAEELSLADEQSRRRAICRLGALSLAMPDENMRTWHRQLLAELEVAAPGLPSAGYEPLSWDQVRELDACGIEIGSHTVSHPALSRVRPDRLAEEIGGSKRRIEQELGHPVVSFCYPNGTPDDLSPEVKEQVRAAGFICAPVAYFDRNVTNDIFELRRVPVGNWRRKFREGLHGVDLLRA